jgi:predicted nucleic acid-binding protein
MTFVCNAGPVIALAKIDHLSLLRHLATHVIIPETVLHEVLAKPGPDSSLILEATRDFLMVRNPANTLAPSIQFASRNLDPGERSVIALASATPSPVTAVLDDAAGRGVASRLQIPVIGFIGLLLVAKQRKYISAVAPLVEQARSRGYWLSDELLEIARSIAGE